VYVCVCVHVCVHTKSGQSRLQDVDLARSEGGASQCGVGLDTACDHVTATDLNRVEVEVDFL
jgi:hypothetical protein